MRCASEKFLPNSPSLLCFYSFLCIYCEIVIKISERFTWIIVILILESRILFWPTVQKRIDVISTSNLSSHRSTRFDAAIRSEMSSTQMALEYLLVYCTSHGLTAIGEPPLPKTYRPVGDSLAQTQRNHADALDSRDAMPVWIMFVFLALATAKYLLSFMVSSQCNVEFL